MAFVALGAGAPALVAWVLIGRSGGQGVALGATFGFLIALRAGYHPAARAASLLAAAAASGALTTQTWAWVALAGLWALAAGAATRIRASAQLGFVALAFVVAPPARGVAAAAVYGVCVLLGTVYGTAGARVAGVPRRVRQPVLGRRDAVIAGTVCGAGVALAAAMPLSVGLGWRHGYWLPMTVVILASSSAQAISARAWQRLCGTAGGLAALLLIAALRLDVAVLHLLLMLALAAAVVASRTRWLQTGWMTVAVVLVSAPAWDVRAVAAQRATPTALGVVILAAGAVFVRLTPRTRLR